MESVSADINVWMLGQAPVQGEGPRLTELPPGGGGRGGLGGAGGGDQDVVTLLLPALEKLFESCCSNKMCFIPISLCKGRQVPR